MDFEPYQSTSLSTCREGPPWQHQLRGDTPDWLTTWIGTRPADAPGTAIWDDATSRIAHYRILHDIPTDQPGLGLRPAEPVAADRWQQLMIRVLEDRCWLADRDSTLVASLAVRSPAELVQRRAELEELVATAPPDQRQLIERITNSDVEPTELHQHLVEATRVQDARRDWILANWPHVVELQQINALIAVQPALAHWPTAQPDEVLNTLDMLRQLAPVPEQREERGLAELDQLAIDNDPVLKLEAEWRRLDALASRADSDPERQALDGQLAKTSQALHEARRAQQIERVFATYMPNAAEARREDRALTLAHDTLTDPPAWVVDYVEHLHDTGQLATTRLDEIVTRVAIAAAHLDQHGYLPTGWPALQVNGVERVVPEVEIPIPTQ